jgi:hypothetical protein
MTAMLRPSLVHFVAASLLLACAACSKPEPPDKEQPPEPQAMHDTQLRDAIQAPIDRAKAVEPAVLDAAQQQKDAIDAQAGG